MAFNQLFNFPKLIIGILLCVCNFRCDTPPNVNDVKPESIDSYSVDNATNIEFEGTLVAFDLVNSNELIAIGKNIGTEQMTIVRTNLNGNTIWSKSLSGKEARGHDIIKVSTGGFIVVGSLDSSFGNSNNSNLFVSRLTDSGDTIWTNTWGTKTEDEIGCCVGENIDSTFTIGCYSSKYGNECLFVNVDGENGEVIWTKTYDGSSIGYNPISNIAITSSGDIVGICRSQFFNNHVSVTGLHIIKLTSGGDELWSKTFIGEMDESGNFNCQGYDIIENNDGTFLITGTSFGISEYANELWVLKIDATGNKIWSKTYGGPSFNDVGCWSEDIGYRIIKDPNEGFIVIGSTQRGINTGLETGSYAWIFKSDPDGNIEWENFIGSSKHDSDKGIGCFTLPNGQLLLIGVTSSNSYSQFSRSYDIYDSNTWFCFLSNGSFM